MAVLINGFNTLKSSDMRSEIPLNTSLKRHIARWAAYTGSMEANLYMSFVRNAHQLNISAIGLDGGAHQFDDLFDL